MKFFNYMTNTKESVSLSVKYFPFVSLFNNKGLVSLLAYFEVFTSVCFFFLLMHQILFI